MKAPFGSLLTWKVTVLVAVTFKLLSELGSGSRQAKHFRLRFLSSLVVEFHLNWGYYCSSYTSLPILRGLSPHTTLKGAEVFASIGLKPIMSTQIFLYSNYHWSVLSEGTMSKWMWNHFLLFQPGWPEAGVAGFGTADSGRKRNEVNRAMSFCTL